MSDQIDSPTTTEAPPPPPPVRDAVSRAAAMERKHPMDWAKDADTPWPHLCLAAAVGGWDFTGNMIGVMTRADYDAAIALAVQKFADVRAGAGVAPKHVLILPHSTLLHAVIVKRPLGLALRTFVEAMGSDVLSAQQRGDMQADHFAQHCLWPAEGTAERQDLMDMMPGAFFFDYPNGMQRIVGFSGGEVKKRA